MNKSTGEPTGVGRPRLFDDETERKMLVDAAIQVMSRNDYADMSVDDVLTVAGLSTRAFYRHFDSKDAVLGAIVVRETESVGRALRRAVSRAPHPVAALEAWLDRYLDVFYEPRRAQRSALLSSKAVSASYMTPDVIRDMRDISCQPLIEALHTGHQAGILRSPSPIADAYSIYELVNAARSSSHDPPDRETVKAHVIRFTWPALGLTPNARPIA